MRSNATRNLFHELDQESELSPIIFFDWIDRLPKLGIIGEPKKMKSKPEIIHNERSKKTRREQMKISDIEDNPDYNEIYLVGPEHDIYKIAFVNPYSKDALKFELKSHDHGEIRKTPVFSSTELVRIVSPKEAKKLLKQCKYKYSSGEKIPKPHKDTLKKVFQLLSYKN